MPKNDNPGAVELLEEDHRKVEGLFKKFESAEGPEKEEIANQVDLELRVHSMIEEEILYPALRDSKSEMIAEAFEEHGLVEELLNELATMDLGDEQFEAKFKVMQENVEHHIEEEEKELLPQTKKLQNYDDMGMQMVQRKVELMEQLGMEDEPSGRATTSGEPATMRASEKSESLEPGSSPPVAQRPERSRRSRRAAAISGRRGRR